MRVVLATISKFHSFHLARELERRGHLTRIFTGRARWRLRGENLPAAKVVTFPYLQTLFEGWARFGPTWDRAQTELNWSCHQTFDDFTARHLPPCDYFHGLSYSALRSGRRAQAIGARWICDSPQTHPAAQDRLLEDEFQRLGLPYRKTQQRFLDYAQESFATADVVTALSRFATGTFVAAGVPARKIETIPLGADLTRFRPRPKPADGRFRVLFVGTLSVRKGVHDLLDAVRLCADRRMSLTMVGSAVRETGSLLARGRGLRVEARPPLPQDELARIYAEADVLVVPSIDDAFGMVICEAMASGCPVVATCNTGAPDVIEPGRHGFIVPIRSPGDIADKLTWLADNPLECAAMGTAAHLRIRDFGGWRAYGDRVESLMRRMTAGENSLPATAVPA